MPGQDDDRIRAAFGCLFSSISHLQQGSESADGMRTLLNLDPESLSDLRDRVMAVISPGISQSTPSLPYQRGRLARLSSTRRRTHRFKRERLDLTKRRQRSSRSRSHTQEIERLYTEFHDLRVSSHVTLPQMLDIALRHTGERAQSGHQHATAEATTPVQAYQGLQAARLAESLYTCNGDLGNLLQRTASYTLVLRTDAGLNTLLRGCDIHSLCSLARDPNGIIAVRPPVSLALFLDKVNLYECSERWTRQDQTQRTNLARYCQHLMVTNAGQLNDKDAFAIVALHVLTHGQHTARLDLKTFKTSLSRIHRAVTGGRTLVRIREHLGEGALVILAGHPRTTYLYALTDSVLTRVLPAWAASPGVAGMFDALLERLRQIKGGKVPRAWLWDRSTPFADYIAFDPFSEPATQPPRVVASSSRVTGAGSASASASDDTIVVQRRRRPASYRAVVDSDDEE